MDFLGWNTHLRRQKSGYVRIYVSFKGVEERKGSLKVAPHWGDECRKWGSKACDPWVTAGRCCGHWDARLCWYLWWGFGMRREQMIQPSTDAVFISQSLPKWASGQRGSTRSLSFSLLHCECYLSCWSLINGGCVCSSFIGVALIVSLRQPFLLLHHSAL